jgi:hypothetical protein
VQETDATDQGHVSVNAGILAGFQEEKKWASMYQSVGGVSQPVS